MSGNHEVINDKVLTRSDKKVSFQGHQKPASKIYKLLALERQNFNVSSDCNCAMKIKRMIVTLLITEAELWKGEGKQHHILSH